jgi:hypothetical protein
MGRYGGVRLYIYPMTERGILGLLTSFYEEWLTGSQAGGYTCSIHVTHCPTIELFTCLYLVAGITIGIYLR